MVSHVYITLYIYLILTLNIPVCIILNGFSIFSLCCAEAVSQNDYVYAETKKYNFINIFHMGYKEKEEEELLTDWMVLIHERQTLLRREAEITHL